MVDLVVVKFSDSIRHLRRVYLLQVVNYFLIFAQKDMVFVNFPLDLKCLILFEYLFVDEPLWLETHVNFHNCLIVYIMLARARAMGTWLLLWLYQSLIFRRPICVK